MSLAQLPDELLISVFERLNLTERHRALPLVSRRCWQLVCSPQLLHNVNVATAGDDEEAMARLRSLACFLLQHGAGRVRQLQLDLGCCGEREENAPECLALVAAVCTACSGLQELNLTCEPTVVLSSWLLPLGGSLRRLRIGSDTPTAVAGSLEFLTALQDLELGLWTEGVDFRPDARLPTSITRLALGGGSKDTLPPQVGRLRRLQHLHLYHPYQDAATYEPLVQLPLHTLELIGCVPAVPSCLSALTSLKVLVVDLSFAEHQDASASASLASALPQLTGLSRLAIATSKAEPLPALTALTGLRWLCWSDRPANGAAALPPGAWLQGLRTLAAPGALVARSLPALAAAHRLQELCLYVRPKLSPQDLQQLSAVVRWAEGQPTFKRLLLGNGQLPGLLWADIAAASHRRPSLCIEAGTIRQPGFSLFDV